MARLFAENEIRVVDEWSKREVASKGFIEPDAKTGEAFLAAIGNQPVTFEWLDKVAQAMVKAGWVLYAVPISKEEAEYNRIFDALSQGEKDAFGAWWGRQGTAVDKSAKAATLLINWCAGRGVTQANLDLAMGNLASRGLLTVRQPSNYRGGIHSGKDLRDEVPLSERTDALGNRLHPSREPSPAAKAWAEKEARDAAKGNPSAASDAAWKEKWENLQGNNYPQTAKVRAILINNPDGSPNYRAMYESGLLLLDESGKQPFRR